MHHRVGGLKRQHGNFYNHRHMGQLRFFRRMQLAPGVRLNLSKRGASVSFGVRGAHLTVGRSGIRRTVGLPGTGLFYTSHQGWHSGAHTAPHFAPPGACAPPPSPASPQARNSYRTIAFILAALLLLTILGQIFGR